ncbi:recombinase family protein [Amycolatopsis silviterrae]|uniref:Recombinase family protein n=1 Tax=Amycolatopsis silviterrae TaxID=1656914 RepID=A0ABW5H6J7_9PSEU
MPAKRAKGIKKTFLEPHPVEGPVVTKAFHRRAAERVGHEDIARRLNVDLVTNPPPTPPDPERAVGFWTGANVRDMLSNPKHTGHMVWNRRARKGGGRNRANPVSEWYWSTEKTHEPLVDLETFVLAQQVSLHRERSRIVSENRNPEAKRTYKLRSFLFCSCGRRMHGKSKHERAYYVCVPKKEWRPEGHPGSTPWIQERYFVDGPAAFLSSRVFGRYRQRLLEANLQAVDEDAQQGSQKKIAALRRSIADTEAKSKRLLRSLEVAEDVDQELIRDINERRAELRAEREQFERQLVTAEDEVKLAPNPALLGFLPMAAVDLAAMPDQLSRRLFESLRLEIRCDYKQRTATCRVTLLGDTINLVAATTREAVVLPFSTTREEGPAVEDRHRYPNDACNEPRQIQGVTASVTLRATRRPAADGPNGTVCAVPPAGLEPAT